MCKLNMEWSLDVGVHMYIGYFNSKRSHIMILIWNRLKAHLNLIAFQNIYLN